MKFRQQFLPFFFFFFTDRYLLCHFFGEGYSEVVTTPQIIITGLPADTLLEARAAETTGIVPALVKRRKKKDEVGQSGVLPFVADNSSFPVSFWDESSRALKVQVKALLSIREDKNQTQLGVESILCAGRIHGHRPTLCRKGRGFNQTLESTDACFLMCLSGVT